VWVAAAATWLLVDAPVYLANPRGWSEFYTFSSERGIDFGSVWLAATYLDWTPWPSGSQNGISAAAFLVLCAAIGLLGLLVRRPSLAQLGFLVVAAFAVTNKVYSPQYVLWLVPLAALARPRWPAFLVWQACEAAYWLGIWRFLLGQTSEPAGIDGSIGTRLYAWIIVLHVVATMGYGVLVVVDMVRGRPGGDLPAPAPPDRHLDDGAPGSAELPVAAG
jgi:hypothetical protein